MQHTISNGTLTKRSIQSWMYAFLVIPVLVLAVFQDYLYSVLKGTGFYLSESALYNTIWIFLVPISPIAIFLFSKVKSKPMLHQVGYATLVSIALSLLHIFISTSFFIFISRIAYATPHRFAHMFSSALSNQWYILVLIYAAIPFIKLMLNKKVVANSTPSKTNTKLLVKEGRKRTLIDTVSIIYIASNKPYTIVHTRDGKYLCDENLKGLESRLGSTFLRVHRSFIINKQCVVSVASRKNGDYDATLTNDYSVRMSRHLRQNWETLLH